MGAPVSGPWPPEDYMRERARHVDDVVEGECTELCGEVERKAFGCGYHRCTFPKGHGGLHSFYWPLLEDGRDDK